MSRGWGVVQFLHRTLPHWVQEAFSVVTQLGDAWLFFLLGALLYWYSDDRDTFGFLIGATLGALSLTLALKGFFALARPPDAVRFVEATGYGFPSGHAIGSTVFWFLLALSLDRWSRGKRFAAAGAMVAVVCLSRLVLGVHFAVDVVAGVAVGVAYLAVVVWGLNRRPRATFALAVLCAFAAFAVAVVLSPVETALAETGLVDAVTALGGTVGAFVTWELVGPPDGTVGGWSSMVGLLVFGGLSAIGLKASLPLVVVFVINAVVQGGILAYPKIIGRKEIGG
ncbi:phosphatase PAP2 family protein (plasmid) [Haladaptatus sp. SPP-AMP-3]|uniref:phosphatase PAP2 family protein n=1 Tax=Haladaptatus sp. SPP-AMP-3 TaxID=3121295 RepID=UPI003C2E19E6